MILQIVVYGWAIPFDRFRGKGSGTFVDMTYHLEVPSPEYAPTVGQILDYINGPAGFNFQPLRYKGQVVQDKVTISELSIGIEPMPEPPQEPPGPYGSGAYPPQEGEQP
jgi:hypothetical protein